MFFNFCRILQYKVSVMSNKHGLHSVHCTPLHTQALVELIEEEDLVRRATCPEKAEIREIACHLAARVFQMAVEEGIKVSFIIFYRAGQATTLSRQRIYVFRSKSCYLLHYVYVLVTTSF